MADAILDRVLHNAYKIELKGEESMRKLRSKIDATETLRECNLSPSGALSGGWPTSSECAPTGLLTAAGVGSVVGGTNGALVTYQHIIDLETAVANANGIQGNLAYLTNAKVRGKLKSTFTNSTYGEIPLWNDERLNGYAAVASNQVSSALTKGTASGVCSAVIFGNWSDLIIGQWGGIEIAVDPATYFSSGDIQIRVLADVDVAVRHSASFAIMKDALTA
jgi:HK97 family phage major capsid protein